jgi:hypothetical protein
MLKKILFLGLLSFSSLQAYEQYGRFQIVHSATNADKLTFLVDTSTGETWRYTYNGWKKVKYLADD